MPSSGSDDHINKYQELLDEVSDIINKSPNNHTMWMGDLNASLQRTKYKQDRMLQKFAREMELSPGGNCSDVTYHHFTNNSTSQIDYILVSQGMLEYCSGYGVRMREATNVSSHDPIQIRLAVKPLGEVSTKALSTVKPRPRWEKLDLEMYQQLTHDSLGKLLETSAEKSLDDLIESLGKILIEAERESTPQSGKQNRKRKKPWTPKMTRILKDLKKCYWEWKREGRPRDEGNSSLILLKSIKKQLKQEQRQTAARQRLQEQEAIMKAHHDDHKVFHKLIRKQMGQKDNLPDEMIIDEQLVSGENLLPALKKYFETLASPKNLPQYDANAKERHDIKNEQLVVHYTENPKRILPDITPQVVLEVIGALKKGKAPDPTGLMAEHLFNASPLVSAALATIINKIIHEQQIPAALKHGTVTPVFKKKKSPKNIDNYRRITITMLVNKVLEKIIQDPLKDILNPQLCNLQRGFIEGASSINTALILSEAVAEAADNNQALYTLFLDASKCFDVVYHNAMLNRLHDQHIYGDLWMLLNDNYKQMTSDIKWKGQTSEKFEEGQGIRQGGSNSAHVFIGKTNPFLQRMEKSGIGSHIGSIYVGTPTCADDVALLADNVTDLQTMAELAWIESTQERFQYSATKSKAMIFQKNQRKQANMQPIIMNEAEIEYSTEETHLGIIRTPDAKCIVAAEERIQKARKSAYMLLGRNFEGINGLHPATSLNIISRRITPVLTYGFEVTAMNDTALQKLETYMRTLLKRIQFLPRETATCAVHILLGTMPTEAILDTLVICLYVRVLHLHSSREKEIVARQLALKDMQSASWTQKVRAILSKYSLPSPYDLLENTPLKGQWSKQVRRAVQCYWYRRLVEEAAEKSTLKYLNSRCYSPGQLHHVWSSVDINHLDIKKAQVKARILVGRYCLQADKARYKKEDPVCKICRDASEDLEHFLLYCPRLQSNREGYMQKLHAKLWDLVGEAHAEEIISNPGKLIQVIVDSSFILGGNPEATLAVEIVSRNLCYSLHSARSALLPKDDKTTTKRLRNKNTDATHTPNGGGYTTS